MKKFAICSILLGLAMVLIGYVLMRYNIIQANAMGDPALIGQKQPLLLALQFFGGFIFLTGLITGIASNKK